MVGFLKSGVVSVGYCARKELGDDCGGLRLVSYSSPGWEKNK